MDRYGIANTRKDSLELIEKMKNKSEISLERIQFLKCKLFAAKD
jgi:hypothetical protein